MKPRTATRSVNVDGLSVAYWDTGPRDAPAVLLIHGFIESHLMWRRLSPSIETDFRVLALDLPGHGESDRISDHRNLDEVRFVPLLGDAVTAMCNDASVNRAAVVGHSLGGAVAAYLAAARPELVQGALLLDPVLFILDPDVYSTTHLPELFAGLEPVIRAAQASDDPEGALMGVLAAAPSMTGRGTFLDVLGDQAATDLAHSWARTDIEMLHGALEDAGDPARRFWGGHSPDTPITTPVTVVRADPTLGPLFFPEHEERLRQATPHARIIEASGSSHLVHIDKPDWLADQVASFLASLTPDTPTP